MPDPDVTDQERFVLHLTRWQVVAITAATAVGASGSLALARSIAGPSTSPTPIELTLLADRGILVPEPVPAESDGTLTSDDDPPPPHDSIDSPSAPQSDTIVEPDSPVAQQSDDTVALTRRSDVDSDDSGSSVDSDSSADS